MASSSVSSRSLYHGVDLETLPHAEIDRVAQELGVADKFTHNTLMKGYAVELEHGLTNPLTNVTDDVPIVTLKIAIAHLLERPNYYEELEAVETKSKFLDRALERRSVAAAIRRKPGAKELQLGDQGSIAAPIRGKQIFEEFVKLESDDPDANTDALSLTLTFLERELLDRDVEWNSEEMINDVVNASQMFVDRLGAVRTEDGEYFAAHANLQINQLLQLALKRAMVTSEEYSDLKEMLQLPFIVLVLDRWKMEWPKFQALLNRTGAAGKLEELPRVEQLTAQGQRLRARFESLTMKKTVVVVLTVAVLISLSATYLNRRILTNRLDVLENDLEPYIQMADSKVFQWIGTGGEYTAALTTHDSLTKEIRTVVTEKFEGNITLSRISLDTFISTKNFAYIKTLSEEVQRNFKTYLDIMLEQMGAAVEINTPVWNFVSLPKLEDYTKTITIWSVVFGLWEVTTGGAASKFAIGVLTAIPALLTAIVLIVTQWRSGSRNRELEAKHDREQKELRKQIKELTKAVRVSPTALPALGTGPMVARIEDIPVGLSQLLLMPPRGSPGGV